MAGGLLLRGPRSHRTGLPPAPPGGCGIGHLAGDRSGCRQHRVDVGRVHAHATATCARVSPSGSPCPSTLEVPERIDGPTLGICAREAHLVLPGRNPGTDQCRGPGLGGIEVVPLSLENTCTWTPLRLSPSTSVTLPEIAPAFVSAALISVLVEPGSRLPCVAVSHCKRYPTHQRAHRWPGRETHLVVVSGRKAGHRVLAIGIGGRGPPGIGGRGITYTLTPFRVCASESVTFPKWLRQRETTLIPSGRIQRHLHRFALPESGLLSSTGQGTRTLPRPRPWRQTRRSTPGSRWRSGSPVTV